MAVLTREADTSFTQSALTASSTQITGSVAAVAANEGLPRKTKNERLILTSLPDHLLSDLGRADQMQYLQQKRNGMACDTGATMDAQ